MAACNIKIVDIGMKTGVIAVLLGGKPGKTIVLWEDVDALPMLEEMELPFASRFPGKATPLAMIFIQQY